MLEIEQDAQDGTQTQDEQSYADGKETSYDDETNSRSEPSRSKQNIHPFLLSLFEQKKQFKRRPREETKHWKGLKQILLTLDNNPPPEPDAKADQQQVLNLVVGSYGSIESRKSRAPFNLQKYCHLTGLPAKYKVYKDSKGAIVNSISALANTKQKYDVLYFRIWSHWQQLDKMTNNKKDEIMNMRKINAGMLSRLEK